MKLDASQKRQATAVAAFKGREFTGYAVRTQTNTWIAVGALGISWAKWNCATLPDAQNWLRTTSYAARFDLYSEPSDLTKIIDKLPPYQQPSITIESFGGILDAPAKLSSQSMVYFTPS
jgi:hypothetical protein